MSNDNQLLDANQRARDSAAHSVGPELQYWLERWYQRVGGDGRTGKKLGVGGDGRTGKAGGGGRGKEGWEWPKRGWGPGGVRDQEWWQLGK